ncbi:MAG TPA: hypothetical protein VKP69_24885 [Isosphaeraceae bacterium]|nr:hypothetical protein [Isosphaeraceae bacterium]
MGLALVAPCGVALGQSPSETAQAAAPAAAAASAPPPSREALLEERLRKLEAMNQKILQQYEASELRHNQRYEKLSQEFKALQERLEAESARGASEGDPAGDGDGGRPAAGGGAAPGEPIGPEATRGPQGTISRTRERPAVRPGGIARRAGAAPGEPIGPEATRGPQGTISRTRELPSLPGKVTVSRGFRWTSDDNEFQLVFHDLTQAELRSFPGAGDQSPLHTQFFIPRQRWYFIGRATKDVEFYTVINRGYGSIDLLDAFLDFKYLGPKAVLRVGRTKTPASYEYYQIAEGDLIAPERSLFTGNLSGNRQNGFMEHGRILGERAEYALGVFNGPRRSFQDFNNDKDLFVFFNIRPFEKSERLKALNIMNFGGAYRYGTQNNPLQPNIFTTANDQSSTTADVTVQSLSPEFLRFNDNVVENGALAHWAAWIAWYYKSFNLLAQYDGGYQDYALTHSSTRTRVSQTGYFAQAYYFLTGEQIKRRVDVTPNRDFSIRNGRITGPGAIEVHARYSYLNLGHDVFTAGLADPNLWTNQAHAIDTGINWYPNQYTKIYIDWQHSVFGNQVFNGPRAFHKQANLVWLRFQLFF